MIHIEPLELERALALRTEILRPHFEPGRLARYDGDEDPGTRHFGALDAGQVVAVATFLRRPAPFAPEAPALQLRGMAVARQRQRQGLGRRLLDASMAALAVDASPIRRLWCNARVSAQTFYEGAGFRVEGPRFEVPEIGPHVVMWRELPEALAG